MRGFVFVVVGLFFFVSVPTLSAAKPTTAVVDFSSQIRPIISSKCFACHGQDDGSRKAKLRLDIREEAIKERDEKKIAIKPGDINHSELVRRITTKDLEDVMPPPKEGHALTANEISLLKNWIQQGAVYSGHWAFRKPERPVVPKVKNKSWPKNEIDFFILQKLEANRLKPSPPAERYALIRRLSLDLTGLPATPSEVNEFINDKSPNAYEKIVDRLMSSPHYGERWARMWLDIARYADSAGYGSDPLRLGIWPYRDWVIKAFDRNLRYDQFTIEQLAGDLLENPTEEQIIASAFHRNTMTNTEGGTDDEEWRVAAVKDRANITAQAWMGLTMGCAQCHTHKFDPITQREYYSFYSFFNQTEDDDKPDESPTLPLPTKEEREKMEQLKNKISAMEKKLESGSPELMTELSSWEKTHEASNAWTALEPIEFSGTNGTKLTKLDDYSLLAVGDSPVTDTYKIKVRSTLTNATALRLEVLPDESLPMHGAGRSKVGNFVLNNFQVTAGTNEQKIVLTNATATFDEKKFEIEKAIDGKPSKKSGWSITGAQTKAQTAVFEISGPSPSGILNLELAQTFGAKNTLGRFRISATTLPAPVFAVPTNISPILLTAVEKRSTNEQDEILKWFQKYSVTDGKIRRELDGLKKDLDAIKPTALPIMRELALDKHRTTKLLHKGNYLEPTEEVNSGVPAAFNPWPSGAPTNRTGVAQWLLSPENPLTARVAVNRFWSQIFGVGIVETEEDFGTQGTLPSHPELLDWLALEFQNGWDMKALLKKIVMSATYQQSARTTPELLAKDPRNRLLSRSPRARLDAEMVRDQSLALSGLLSQKIGGPSVYPPQPDGLWRAAFNGQREYKTSTGEDRYRRGLYTIWRRTIPYPSMATFDAPSREACTFRRLPTNTPLQAYVTMNDPVYVEAAQALARRIVREGGATIEEKIQFGLRLVLERPSEKSQIVELKKLYESELAHYRSKDKEAIELATKPLGALPKELNAAEAAAWTVIANVLLNLDGVLTKS